MRELQRRNLRREDYDQRVNEHADVSPEVVARLRAASTDGRTNVLTFQSPDLEIEALTGIGHPFFRPQWGPNVVGMVLDPDVDWSEVSELLIESYCLLAPKKLVALVDRPD